MQNNDKQPALRLRRKKLELGTADELLEIGKRCAAPPDGDSRTAEQILGYDKDGVPS